MKISASSILFGAILVISTSFIITKISPIHEITEQVFERTHADLYALVIAIFSGAAGVYTIIKRKGEEIIGVALATSLLPPLAVVGFGLSLKNYDIARGASFLCITNLLAIAVSATILSKWYGFGFKNSTSQTFWQVFVTLLIFIVLSVPLGISLTDIVFQIQTRNAAKSKINEYFKVNEDLNFIKVSFLKKDRVDVKAVVYTELYNNAAQEEISSYLEKSLNKKVLLILEQVIYQEGFHPGASMRPLSKKEIANLIRKEVHLPIQHIEIDSIHKTVHIYPVHHKNVNAKFLYETEKSIARRFSGWRIKIYPHVVQLPTIYFMVNKDSLSGEEEEKLDTIEWMIKNWEVSEVVVTGFTDSPETSIKFDPDSMIGKRIDYIIKKLKDRSISAIPRVTHDPTALGASYGIANSQKIQVSPQGTVSDLPQF